MTQYQRERASFEQRVEQYAFAILVAVALLGVAAWWFQ